MAKLIRLTSSYCELSKDDIIGPRMMREFARARWAIMHISREHHKHSLTYIGRYLGNRDHTTALYGLRRAKQLLESKDKAFTKLVEFLTSNI